MLTIFSCLKPFTGSVAVGQRNALTSWTLLQPRPEILLFGDVPGAAEICRELAIRHVPGVATSEFGTPLISDIFRKAHQLGTGDRLCYVNADIIFMSDFGAAVERVFSLNRPFLMSGQRWGARIDEPLDFGSDWEKRLRKRAVEEGRQDPHYAMDYFVFPRGFFEEVPPFTIGRPHWDNWMLYRGRTATGCLIDATQAVLVLHQNHDHAHVPQGDEGFRNGPEARRNQVLAGPGGTYTLRDATWRLMSDGRIRWSPAGVLRLNWIFFWWREQFFRRAWYPFLGATRPLRHRLGLPHG